MTKLQLQVPEMGMWEYREKYRENALYYIIIGSRIHNDVKTKKLSEHSYFKLLKVVNGNLSM